MSYYGVTVSKDVRSRLYYLNAMINYLKFSFAFDFSVAFEGVIKELSFFLKGFFIALGGFQFQFKGIFSRFLYGLY